MVFLTNARNSREFTYLSAVGGLKRLAEIFNIDKKQNKTYNCNAIVNTKKRKVTMNKSATIQTRIDPRIKNSAQIILNKLNISMSEAIAIFLTQVSLTKGIPFDIKIPNELTAETLSKADNGEELHNASDVDQLLKDLNN